MKKPITKKGLTALKKELSDLEKEEIEAKERIKKLREKLRIRENERKMLIVGGKL